MLPFISVNFENQKNRNIQNYLKRPSGFLKKARPRLAFIRRKN